MYICEFFYISQFLQYSFQPDKDMLRVLIAEYV